ncbi:MerR family transcriptional regulator [Paenibacillus silvae]|uniref:MerR family transcriptional regulator n=1 Tax=Paenibacillus silvae TaxID=1325358 RepID=UPI0025A12D88|nr:MerR family transcriptional regulator [Paenibacillus silvae]MDM5279653.1 MerR family transcriptional regulator [Paenibacillus silvae]
MKKRYFTIKEIMQITGITKRTLHYYDQTHLLKPSKIEANGYRLYDQEALGRLQTILLFKEMNFTLQDIAAVLELSIEEQKEMLRTHRMTLVERKEKLEATIRQLDHYVDGTDRTQLELFRDSPIHSIQSQYESEAKLIYGETQRFQEYEANMAALSPAAKEQANQQFAADMEEVFQKLAVLQHLSPAAEEVQDLVLQWKRIISRYMTCDAEILRCIAEIYRTDSRYITYFRQFGDESFLQFLHEAICISLS